MKNVMILGLLFMAVLFLAACTENLNPLAPGSTDGQYAMGMKALVPLAIGNIWNYNVVLFDTSGAERTRYSYVLSVIDTVKADTSKIPLSNTTKQSVNQGAFRWYLLQGEMGVRSYWQVDTLENLRIRKTDDTLFLQQSAFDFRASVGTVTTPRSIGVDTILWASGDTIISVADFVQSALLSKGVDTLRTTLGSGPYFKYGELYPARQDSINYYFKPGFGLVYKEQFHRVNGRMVRIRRDELVSYYFK